MARIQTNVSALNANRNLSITSKNLAKSIAKLSSGFRINRAADDAAGLAIANKLRADGRSMRQAARNAAQANSVLQISDGATSTISTILDRMKELATQAATDNVSTSQRLTLQNEFVALRSEIGRIVKTTKYQGQLLIDGSFGASVNASSTLDDDVTVSNITLDGTAADTYKFTIVAAGKLTVQNKNGASPTLTQVVDISAGAQSVSVSLFGISFNTDSAFDNTTSGSINNDTLVVDAGTQGRFLVSSSGSYATDDTVTVSNINLQTDAANLDLDSSSLSGAISNSQATLTKLDAAIVKVATAIGTIGAGQGRIEFATANVNSLIENVAAAESVIRDADLAFEMIAFTKNQILQQAGTAMLAQANSAPQGVLSLLAR